MNSQLSDEDTRVYQLAQEQKLDPIRAVLDNRKVESVVDPNQRMHVRRHLTGVTIPLDPDDKDMTDFVAVSKNWQGRFEHLDSRVESIISAWYESTTGRKFRALHFLYGADDLIRSIAEKAMQDFPAGIDARPDELIAFSTPRPGDYWKITSFESLQMVMELMSLDIHCDLDLMKNTDVGPCLDQYAWLHKLKEQDKAFTLPEHKDHYQREYIPQYFAAIPFAYGNVIVLARICMTCYSAWFYRNQIQTDRISEIEPIGDGFGSVGGGPIAKSEYKWAESVVDQVCRDWELRNGKSPTIAQLQNALQDVEFVGQGSDEAVQRQKRTKKKYN